jgi:hypothetical protein
MSTNKVLNEITPKIDSLMHQQKVVEHKTTVKENPEQISKISTEEMKFL